ncbi:hypothetical protein SCHPADRAFT_627762 [Schizopora paradoxa]|uniref:Peptidase M48 domain-containing protein n=1 Tax=Schizopora paradoxa TaxID=27342 RepID=A0A0H2RSW0_9AGAM|nr:hypothetical protein SCHPADRAFT_627762 [Schizopora paradoxa]
MEITIGACAGRQKYSNDWITTGVHRRDVCTVLCGPHCRCIPEENNPQRALFHAPPVKYSLSIRPALRKRLSLVKSNDFEEGENLLIRHGKVVVDAPICNVCSIGFGTSMKQRAKSVSNAFGIFIVATGLLDAILGPDAPPEDIEHRIGPFVHKKTIARSSRKSATSDKTCQLTAILSHELSHILLAHYWKLERLRGCLSYWKPYLLTSPK